MKILFTFPGQGNQRPDMLAALPDRQNILAEARTVLGDEVDHLDTAAALKHTRAVQLCLLIAGAAWARELQRQGVKPDMVSGLSIGLFRRRSLPARWISPTPFGWWRCAAI